MNIFELETKKNSWSFVKDKYILKNEIKKNPATLINALAHDFETGIFSSSWLENNKILTKQHKYNLIRNLFIEIINLKNSEELTPPLKQLFKKLKTLFQEVEPHEREYKFKQIVIHALDSKNDWIAKKIIKLIADTQITQTQIEDQTLLYKAIYSNCPKTLEYILKNAKFSQETITSAIFFLCETPNTNADTITQLIKLHGTFDLNCENRKYQTPLLIAYESSNLNAFKLLLNLGARLEQKNSIGTSVQDLMHSCFANNSFNPIAIEAINDYNSNRSLDI